LVFRGGCRPLECTANDPRMHRECTVLPEVRLPKRYYVSGASAASRGYAGPLVMTYEVVCRRFGEKAMHQPFGLIGPSTTLQVPSP
jgi:hypothetical protein